MKKQLFILGVATIIGLSGCGNNSNGSDSDSKKESNQSEMDHSNMNKSEMNHSEMNHSTSGKVPEGLQEAKDPKYKVGSQAVMKADHMKGMNGAKATIVGAYDTTVYTVSYTPTTGGEKVINHKWVIQEELKDADDKTFKAGDEVTLEADHMEGMKGAKATIDSAEKTTVYMVDYTPTTGGEKVTNHKWVTESELSDK
ncbi:YdhK family protein [Priestia flexa]|uniref:YdhK family protein n=1 Tax=Priestia flexa TaxID=86664 RepID=UPI001A8E5910|nr:YdhK family protein [Priestia flexa]MBN8435686.1 YdhK family protein [Priestia flexa]MCA0968242.1 YdhK family protein [Priestia flexa]